MTDRLPTRVNGVDETKVFLLLKMLLLVLRLNTTSEQYQQRTFSPLDPGRPESPASPGAPFKPGAPGLPREPSGPRSPMSPF